METVLNYSPALCFLLKYTVVIHKMQWVAWVHLKKIWHLLWQVDDDKALFVQRRILSMLALEYISLGIVIAYNIGNNYTRICHFTNHTLQSCQKITTGTREAPARWNYFGFERCQTARRTETLCHARIICRKQYLLWNKLSNTSWPHSKWYKNFYNPTPFWRSMSRGLTRKEWRSSCTR